MSHPASGLGAMARHTYGAIAERSRKQLGLIVRAQLRQLGVSRHQEQNLVDIGILQRVEPRVLCVLATTLARLAVRH